MPNDLKIESLLNRIFQIESFADIEELTFPLDAPTWDEQTEWLDKFLEHMRVHAYSILEGVLFELTEAEAWCEYWQREALRKYPTPDAYEAVCRARDKWQQLAEQAKQEWDNAVDQGYKQYQRIIRLREANTAMREYLLNLRDRTPYGMYQEEIDSLLSRYPKEPNELQQDIRPVYGSPEFPFIYHEDKVDGLTIVPEAVARNMHKKR